MQPPMTESTVPVPNRALKPAGFWGVSRYPAKGAPYNYTLLVGGVIVSLLMAIFVVRLLRRTGRQRLAQQAARAVERG